MGQDTWQVSADGDPKALGRARVLAHNAVHWLSRMANSYVASVPQQQHVALTFDAQRHALITRSFAGDVAVELRLPRLEMQFREGNKLVPHVLDVEGHSSAQIEAWMLVELLHRGIDRDRFSKQLPYVATDLMVGDTVEYAPQACAKELAELSVWFANAQCVLRLVALTHAGDHRAPDIVCWPEHFQMGLLLPMEPGGQVGERALRVALSAGDERTPEPYFFVTDQTRGTLAVAERGAILTASQVAADKLSAQSVATKLETMIATARKRLAS
jgi:hypothetical protein